MRCGVTGLRPTFGRVRAHGRHDAVLVARQARPDDAQRGGHDARAPARSRGPDAGDLVERAEPCWTSMPAAPVRGLRVGYFPRVDERSPGDRRRSRGARQRCDSWAWCQCEVTLPDWPYDSLMPILFAEAAAAFEELTLDGGIDAAEDAGARRVAQPLPPGALPLGRRLRAGRSAAPQVALEMARMFTRSTCCSCRRCATRC